VANLATKVAEIANKLTDDEDRATLRDLATIIAVAEETTVGVPDPSDGNASDGFKLAWKLRQRSNQTRGGRRV